jgi:hypothetical protein
MGLKSMLAEAWVRRVTGRTVCGGPFAGMRYGEAAVNSCYAPKLLGVYESEVAGFVERVIAWGPKRVINAGAAEGYYAVGLARRLPHTQVLAYEAEAPARALLEANVSANEVGARVTVKGRCAVAELAAELGDGADTVVLVDVEGFEEALCDPEAVPGLRRAWLLVELHPLVVPDIEAELTRRFEPTHAVEKVEVRAHGVDEIAEPVRSKIARMPAALRAKALDEKRGSESGYLVMVAGA